jgi:hypothetical protein
MEGIHGILDRLANSNIWALMGIAMEEIKYKLSNCQPKNRELIYGAFLSLLPIESMRSQATWLYVAHCRELLARLDSDDYSPDSFACMTWAEILSVFADTTPYARLGDIAAHIMYYAGRKVAEYLDKDEAPELFSVLSDYERDFPDSNKQNPMLEREIEELRARKVERAIPKPEPVPERLRGILS